MCFNPGPERRVPIPNTHSYPTIRPCLCDRHDLYLPSIPASLQTLGRCECAAASAPAPHGLRIISPLTLTLRFSQSLWTSTANSKKKRVSQSLQKKKRFSQSLLDVYNKLALISSSHLSTVASVFVLAHPPWFFPPLFLLVASP